ncbi:unnamed protein product [Prunus armeniaca]
MKRIFISGFISIDCGLPETSAYSEQETGITFVSDATFIDTGETKFIQSDDLLTLNYQPFRYLRTFPLGIRNCYNINVTFGTEYLIPAGFYYGNYDAKNKLPEFQLHLGPNLWDTVNFAFSWADTTKEMIYVPVKNYIQLCLVNTSKGVPFISTIELRPLPAKSYVTQTGSFLGLFSRYPNDIHDRIWKADYLGDWAELSTSPNLFTDSNQNSLETPPLVMSTAATPKNASEPLDFYWFSNDNSTEYYIYMHFAEVLQLQPNQSRKFNITRDGKSDIFFSLSLPPSLPPSSLTSSSSSSPSLPLHTQHPGAPQRQTSPGGSYPKSQILVSGMSDTRILDAITNIKLAYQIKKINWQELPSSLLVGRPHVYLSYKCVCKNHILELVLKWINKGDRSFYIQSRNDTDFGFIKQQVNRTSSRFLVSIAEFIWFNLNLEQNQLTGLVPAGLIQRWNDGLLSLSLCESPNVSGNVYCNNNKKKKKKKHGFLIPVVVSVVGVSALLLSAIAIWWLEGNQNRTAGFALYKILIKLVMILGDNVSEAQPTIQLESTKRQLTCSEILQITNNFERVLGRGGFGTVYHGYIGDTQVAVKMLSPSSVNLLTRVHHRNLTSLVGYCEDETKIGLVYEYMANGNLQECLSDRNILSWEDRLRIAVDTAQGLEYLHYGCKPHIIHRDVKSTNILLNENFQAKLSDFGLSRIFPTDTGTYISTVVAGTPGYLDPDYYASNRLNEKSDVYSFGIVLLEIITCRPVFSKTHEKIYISEWVGFMLSNGDIYSILDPRLGGNFNTNSVWKAVAIAMACVSKDSIERPIMSQVVVELKECLATELARTKQSHQTESTNSIGIMPNNSIAMLHPSVR